MTRPTMNIGILVAAVCNATPRQKREQEQIIPILRPIPSATGAARRAPTKVPAERIELEA